jgi:hypothetical protein
MGKRITDIAVKITHHISLSSNLSAWKSIPSSSDPSAASPNSSLKLLGADSNSSSSLNRIVILLVVGDPARNLAPDSGGGGASGISSALRSMISVTLRRSIEVTCFLVTSLMATRLPPISLKRRRLGRVWHKHESNGQVIIQLTAQSPPLCVNTPSWYSHSHHA